MKTNSRIITFTFKIILRNNVKRRLTAVLASLMRVAKTFASAISAGYFHNEEILSSQPPSRLGPPKLNMIGTSSTITLKRLTSYGQRFDVL